MVKRRSRSPEEILSFFDGVEHPKEDDSQSPTGASLILDTVATQEKGDAQEARRVPEPERPDHAAPQRPVRPPRTSPTPKPRTPSWRRAETVSSKQHESATAAGAVPHQATWQQRRQQAIDKLRGSKPHVSNARRKSVILLLPILSVILTFVLYQSLSVQAANWPGADKLVVKSILYHPANASAIIDNQLVREGDKISGATVVKINKHTVEFEVRRWWSRKPQRLKKRVQR